MADYKSILYEHHGPVRLITLNRPEVLNAIGQGMEEELHEALDVAENDDDARVVIIAGAGRAFSSGYDISSATQSDQIDEVSMIAKGSNAAEHISRWFYNDRKMLKNQTHILELSVPVIAAVHGWCMGGGTWLALTCDITLASAGRRVRATGSTANLQYQLPVDSYGRVQKRSALRPDRRSHRRRRGVPHRAGQRGFAGS